MAWIEQKRRSDGGTSAMVRWRVGGTRSGRMQTETFGAGSDDQNLARAEGFKRMVEAAGQEWPDGWVKGEGFVRRHATDDPMKPPPTVAEAGEEYVRQIVDLSPGQRKRYLGQVRTITSVEVAGPMGTYRPFDRTVAQVKEADVKAWLIGWDRSLKTKANYHGLLYSVFGYAVEQGYLAANPCARTAPKRSRIRQSQADLRFLTEDEFATVARLAGENADLLRLAVGTGLQNRRALEQQEPVVEVVIQTVEVERRRPGPELQVRRNGPGWVAALEALTEDLDRGRVYDRDLNQLTQQLDQVVRSLERRPARSPLRHPRSRE